MVGAKPGSHVYPFEVTTRVEPCNGNWGWQTTCELRFADQEGASMFIHPLRKGMVVRSVALNGDSRVSAECKDGFVLLRLPPAAGNGPLVIRLVWCTQLFANKFMRVWLPYGTPQYPCRFQCIVDLRRDTQRSENVNANITNALKETLISKALPPGQEAYLGEVTLHHLDNCSLNVSNVLGPALDDMVVIPLTTGCSVLMSVQRAATPSSAVFVWSIQNSENAICLQLEPSAPTVRPSPEAENLAAVALGMLLSVQPWGSALDLLQRIKASYPFMALDLNQLSSDSRHHHHHERGSGGAGKPHQQQSQSQSQPASNPSSNPASAPQSVFASPQVPHYSRMQPMQPLQPQQQQQQSHHAHHLQLPHHHQQQQQQQQQMSPMASPLRGRPLTPPMGLEKPCSGNSSPAQSPAQERARRQHQQQQQQQQQYHHQMMQQQQQQQQLPSPFQQPLQHHVPYTASHLGLSSRSASSLSPVAAPAPAMAYALSDQEPGVSPPSRSASLPSLSLAAASTSASTSTTSTTSVSSPQVVLPSPFDPTAAPAFVFLDQETDGGYATAKEDGSGASSAAADLEAAWAGWASGGASSPTATTMSMSNLFSKVAMSIMKSTEPVEVAENPSTFQRECNDILSGCSRHLWW